MKQTLSKLLLTAWLLGANHLLAQGTEFTYQGRLSTDGNPANGTYDFRFRLAADALGNNYVGSPWLTNAIPVLNGLFTTALDFGAGVFTGSNYWLEVDVRTNGVGGYTALTPLQAFTPTPYAIFATTASNVSGTVSAAQVSGVLANGSLPGSPVFSGTVTATAIAGNGASVTNVNAATLNGLNASNFWQLGGNNVSAGQFLGSATSQPLELRANGIRVLKLDASGLSGKAVFSGYTLPNGSPNMIGGAPLNYVAPAVVGATIGGGGATNYYNQIWSNSVAADFGTISGGANNSIQANDYIYSDGGGVIGGGENNTIMSNSIAAVIVGGARNTIHTNAYESFIGGGILNSISGKGAVIVGGGYDGTFGANRVDADGSSIVGGVTNIIFAGSKDSFIGGGWNNNIQNQAVGAVIAGGFQNVIQTNSTYSAIGGGINNAIQSGSSACTIAGGNLNSIQTNCLAGTIAGGYLNNLQANDNYSAIGGGYGNRIQSGSVLATIAGGNLNTIQVNCGSAAIVGGYGNVIQTNSGGGFIGGGGLNNIQTNAQNGTLGGGLQNIILTNSYCAFVGGGYGNTAGNSYGSVLGGVNNSSVGYASTAMGYLCAARGDYSMAMGANAQALNAGAFVWADSAGAAFASTNANSFNTRASGGYRLYTTSSGASGAGVYLAPNSAAWATVSDQNAKKNFTPVNGETVLNKLAAVPVEKWNYKWENDSDVPNIGPMAQAFKAAFYPGRDDKSITTLEFDGVELAAIQGLNQKLEATRTENAELKNQNGQLSARLDKLEKLLAHAVRE